jgi:hypothetical protein
MAYSQESIEKNFDLILERIEGGEALRKILPTIPISSETFYRWIDSDELKSKRYARACELRADSIFEDILEIADDSSGDLKITNEGKEIMDSEFVQRSRLRVDARKWIVSKLNPKKYGDRLELDNKLSGEVNIISLGSGKKPDESNS